MSDRETRLLERKASQGDELAMEQLTIFRQRAGRGRHGDKIGQWVVFSCVRDHYRGLLAGVTENGGGNATIHLSVAYWLPSLADCNNEVQITCSEAHPFDLNSDGVLGVSMQRASWSKK